MTGTDAEPAEVERTLLEARTCAWCTVRPATTTVIVEPAIPRDAPHAFAADKPARTARACVPCKTRLERQAAEQENARRSEAEGSRLATVPPQLSLEAELYSDANLAGQVAHLRIAGGTVEEPEPRESDPASPGGQNRCRSCGAAVTFACSTSTGKWMILNAEPSELGNIHVANNGKGRRVARVMGPSDRATIIDRGGSLYLDHHATCPNAEEHRSSARGAA